VIAEREGWDAVTIRRLAEEIEHSQPVLYSHFENRFSGDHSSSSGSGKRFDRRRNALKNVAMAYLAFALRHPALYAAMFIFPTDLRFAEAGTRPELIYKGGFRSTCGSRNAVLRRSSCRDRDFLGSPSWAR
jgi:hypothetical protein